MRFMYLSAITTGLQAVATILSAVKTITVSMRSLTDNPHNDHEQEPRRRGVRLGIHKWILMSGAVVGLVTIAYLENIIINSRAKKTVNQKPQEKFEHVYVSS